ncbi:MAG: hypothetical protein AAF399_17345 [Bacteroidota bacterium]
MWNICKRVSWIFGAIGSLLLGACLQAGPRSSQPEAEALEEEPPQNWRAYARAYRDSPALLVVYGDENEDQGEAYRRMLTDFLDRSPQQKPVLLKACREVSLDSLNSLPVFLVGSPLDHPLLRQWANQLPIQLAEGGFGFHQQTYQQPEELLHLSWYPHPGNDRFPIGMLLSNDPAQAARYLASLDRRGRWGGFWSRWPYQVYREEQRLVMGNFNSDWQVELKEYWNFDAQESRTLSRGHLTIQTHHATFSEEALGQLLDSMEVRTQRVQRFVGTQNQPPPLTCHLYPNAEWMGLTANMQMYGVALPDKQEVHQIFHPLYADQDEALEVQPLLRSYLGKPKVWSLERGLASLFAPRWHKKGALYWAARLVEAGDFLMPEEVLEPMRDHHSYLIRGAYDAAWVQFLLDQWGKARFLEAYVSWQPAAEELQALEDPWKAWLQALPKQYPKVARTVPGISYMKGMTFAHEGYSIYNGYGSSYARQSLEKIASLSANSVAIIPYSGSRQLNRPASFGIWQRAGSENDAAVLSSMYDARSMGMSVLLKPQIYFGGSWPGGLEMKNEADWQAFFGHYRRWIRHYALLAEIYEWDLFCVGVEFVKATTSHPEEWRKLIRDMRQIYQGPVTYAANWGEEIEALAFGDALDYIGVDCYYPLSSQTAPTKKQMGKQFASVKKKLASISQQFDRPILLTEVGFRSIEAPWKQPHDEPHDAPFSEKDQAMCYEVILEGLAGEPWCEGLFWWKWPTYMEYSPRQPRSFTPCGKAAEEVLRKAYAIGLEN